MKLVRKYGIYCGLLFALVAFILMLATVAVSSTGYGLTIAVKGTTAIFGNDGVAGYGTALAAWILALIGLLVVAFLAIAPFVKGNKPAKKIGAFIGLGVAVLFLVAGILVLSVNGEAKFETLGAGWIIAGIFFLVGAAGIAIDPVLVLLGK